MPNRRRFLQALSSLPFFSHLASARPRPGSAGRRDFMQELKLRPFINAGEPYTTLTGSLMPPEVVEAIDYASKQYVRLNDLHDAVGQRIASLVGCEAAMITAGAASALTLGTAACITGANAEFVHRLPDTTGMKNEVIIQKSHRYGYDHAVRDCGIRFIEVEGRDELERSINDRTALMLFYNRNDPVGQIHAQEYAGLGKKHGVPTFNDCAGDVPPPGNLSKYIHMGYDLVTFSGGKGLRGPQSAGLLLGRKDLIHAARLNGPPNSDAIARGQKVNKEEMLAMMVAVELCLTRDHAAEWQEWEKRVKQIAAAAGTVRGVTTERFVPEITYSVPHLRIRWDEASVKIAPREAVRRLREGEPSIELRSSPPDCLEVGVWMLQSGEAPIVARRIREVLEGAAG